MALLFCDGFDHVTSTYKLTKWDRVNSGTNVAYGTGSGSTGGWGAYMSNVTYGYMDRFLRSQVSSIVVGIRLTSSQFSDNGDFLQLMDNASIQVGIRVLYDGSLAVYRNGVLLGASSTGAVSTSTWFYVEAKVVLSQTVGSVEVRVNEETLINLSGIDTCPTTNEYCTMLRMRGITTEANLFMDDLYVCDTTGTENNDFLGDITITTLYPTSDGNSSDFTPSTGVDNYAVVDEPQLTDTTDYVSSSVVGDKDTYGVTTLASVGTVFGVQVTNSVFNKSRGSAKVRAISRSGTIPADNEGSDFALSQTVKSCMHIFEKEPTDDVAWTVAKVNAAEFGIKLQS